MPLYINGKHHLDGAPTKFNNVQMNFIRMAHDNTIVWGDISDDKFRECGTSQTWVVPIGVYDISVCMIGGGGSGGLTTDVAEANKIGGGQAGEIVTQILTVTPGEEIEVVIGTGGAPTNGGSSLGNTAGNSGSATSFGDYLTAAGGSGGNIAPLEACGGFGTKSHTSSTQLSIDRIVPDPDGVYYDTLYISDTNTGPIYSAWTDDIDACNPNGVYSYPLRDHVLIEYEVRPNTLAGQVHTLENGGQYITQKYDGVWTITHFVYLVGSNTIVDHEGNGTLRTNCYGEFTDGLANLTYPTIFGGEAGFEDGGDAINDPADALKQEGRKGSGGGAAWANVGDDIIGGKGGDGYCRVSWEIIQEPPDYEPSTITNFSASDNYTDYIRFYWTKADAKPAATYDVYNGATRILTNVSSGAYKTYTGPYTSTFSVKAVNSENLTGVESNTNSGTSLYNEKSDWFGPTYISDFRASDDQVAQVVCEWEASDGEPEPWYSIYEDGSLLETHVTSPYIRNVSPGTREYKVYAYSDNGAIFSNTDDGTALDEPIPEPESGAHTYQNMGTYYWDCPAGVYNVTISMIGGGGSGAARGGLQNLFDTPYWFGVTVGGGRAGYAAKFNASVVPGRSYKVVIGPGGDAVTAEHDTELNGNDGSNTTISGTDFYYYVTGGNRGYWWSDMYNHTPLWHQGTGNTNTNAISTSHDGGVDYTFNTDPGYAKAYGGQGGSSPWGGITTSTTAGDGGKGVFGQYSSIAESGSYASGAGGGGAVVAIDGTAKSGKGAGGFLRIEWPTI